MDRARGPSIRLTLASMVPSYEIPFEDVSPLIPPPSKVDPRTFYQQIGDRESFVPALLVNYMLAYLGPIYCTLDVFWRYENGVFRKMEIGELRHVAACALKLKGRSNQIGSTIELLGGVKYRAAKGWPEEKLVNCLTGMVDPMTAELKPHSAELLETWSRSTGNANGIPGPESRPPIGSLAGR